MTEQENEAEFATIQSTYYSQEYVDALKFLNSQQAARIKELEAMVEAAEHYINNNMAKG